MKDDRRLKTEERLQNQARQGSYLEGTRGLAPLRRASP